MGPCSSITVNILRVRKAWSAGKVKNYLSGQPDNILSLTESRKNFHAVSERITVTTDRSFLFQGFSLGGIQTDFL